MAKSPKICPGLTGVAGECFVAAELLRQGYIAPISLKNTQGIDIFTTNQNGFRSITIQCKTNEKTGRKWLLNGKSEEFVSKDHLHVFVALSQPTDRPRFYVVPSKVVAERTKQGRRTGLETPDKRGRKHPDIRMRNFLDPEDEFLERWDLLGLG